MINVNKDIEIAAAAAIDLSLDQLLSEQVRDWMGGNCRPFRFYLERRASLIADPEWIIELINQEIVLRRRRGDTPTPQDYLGDFPDLAEPLSHLFEIYNAISIRTELCVPQMAQLKDDGAVETYGVNRSPRIPGYRIERLLGAGGMAIVYLAADLALDRWVALKFLRNGNQGDSGQRSRLELEAAVVAKCQHPHLVQIFQIGEYEGELYLALEYVDGGDLKTQLADKPLPVRRSADLVETLARAVHVAHDAGIVHRDLKPSNILLTAEGVPKVTDFGLAKLLGGDSGRTQSGQVVGTPSYMAPEQAEGRSKDVGPGADVYAPRGHLVRGADRTATVPGRFADRDLEACLYDGTRFTETAPARRSA